MTILLQDNFNDNSFDMDKWILLGDAFSETNQRAEFNLNVLSFDTKIKSFVGVSSGKYTMQSFLSQTPTDEFNIISLGDYGEEIEIKLGIAGTNTFNCTGLQDTGITGGKDVKIEYDFDTGDVTYYYWNGSAWVSMGTYNIFIPPAQIMIQGRSQGIGNPSLCVADDVFFTDNFYTTHYPIIDLPPRVIQKPVTIRRGVRSVAQLQ